jgi:hypothetical protein
VTFNNFSIKNIFNKKAWDPLPAGDGQAWFAFSIQRPVLQIIQFHSRNWFGWQEEIRLIVLQHEIFKRGQPDHRPVSWKECRHFVFKNYRYHACIG